MNITKPRLDQFKITGSTVGDVNFPYVKFCDLEENTFVTFEIHKLTIGATPAY